MTYKYDDPSSSPSDLQLGLQEFYPDSANGALTIADRHEALLAYLAYEDGSLAEVPEALDAHIRHRQFDLD